MIILCLEGNYVDTLESLKEILNRPIDSTSSLSEQIYDIVNSGQLLQWLEERYPTEEAIIADIRRLERISLSISELLNTVVSIFTQKESNVCKPDFRKYAKIRKIEKREGARLGLFSFKFLVDVIEPINETYEIGLKLCESDHQYICSTRISLDVDEGCKEICVELKDVEVDTSTTSIIIQIDNNTIARTNTTHNRETFDFTTNATSTLTRRYEVGDLYDDGTKRGVVFEVTPDGKHGKIVSLEQSDRMLIWSKEDKTTGATSSTDGMANMKSIQTIVGWREKYPAFAWCADLGEGWYLPAQDELWAIYKARNKIDATLSATGCTKLNGPWYWSSSECGTYGFCAWTVSMSSGSTSRSFKINGYCVRAVSAF